MVKCTLLQPQYVILGYICGSPSGNQPQPERQKEHHRNQSFEEEYIALLKAYNIEYDEDYLLKD